MDGRSSGGSRQRRIARLYEEVRGLLGDGRRGPTRSLKGWGVEPIVHAVDAALPAGGDAVLDTILSHVDEVADWPTKQVTAAGDEQYDRHGFVGWIWGLQDGWAYLPKEIPLCVLEAYRDGYLHSPLNTGVFRRQIAAGLHPSESLDAPVSPQPYLRCCDCLMVLPLAAPGENQDVGFYDFWPRCPVCGSARISTQDFSKPLGNFFSWERILRDRGPTARKQ